MLSLLVCILLGQSNGLEGFDRSILTLRAGQLAEQHKSESDVTRRYLVGSGLRQLASRVVDAYSLDDAKEILEIAENACKPFDHPADEIDEIDDSFEGRVSSDPPSLSKAQLLMAARKAVKQFKGQTSQGRKDFVMMSLTRMAYNELDWPRPMGEEHRKALEEAAQEACRPAEPQKGAGRVTRELTDGRPKPQQNAWHQGVINGRAVMIWGTIENGQIKYVEAEQPRARGTVQPQLQYQTFQPQVYQSQPYCPPGQT